MLTLSGAGQPQNGVGIEKRFVISVKTDNAGTSADNEFTLPAPFGGFNYDVETSDGQVFTGLTTDQTFTFPNPGTYDLKISGTFPRISFGYQPDLLKLTKVKNWGIIQPVQINFRGCKNLTSVPSDQAPDLTNVTSLFELFFDCEGLTSLDLNTWDTSTITSLGECFQDCSNLTSLNINDWDVSNVTDMSELVENCSSLVSLDLSNWQTTSLISLNESFQSIGKQDLNLANWDLSNVTTLSRTFRGVSGNVDLSNWDTSNVSDMNFVFNNSNINSYDFIPNFDTSNATTMLQMFKTSNNFDQSLASWDISNVTNFSGFMSYSTNPSGISMSNYDATLISWAAQTPQSNINIDFGTSQYSYEAAAARQTLIDTYGWTITDGGQVEAPEFVISVKTDNVGVSDDNQFELAVGNGYTTYDYNIETSDGQVLNNNTGNTRITFPSAGTYQLKITGVLPSLYFQGTTDKLKVTSIINWGTNPWLSLNRSFIDFKNCVINATDLPNLSQCTSLKLAFYRWESLVNWDVTNLDVSNVTNFEGVFQNCFNLETLEGINNWQIGDLGIDGFKSAFHDCRKLTSTMEDWDVTNIRNIGNMFNNAYLYDNTFGKWNITGDLLPSNRLGGLNAKYLSTPNYDDTLIKWENQLQIAFPNGVGYISTQSINFGSSQYTLGGAAAARQTLIDTYGWTITDGGQAVSPEFALKWETTTPNEEIQIGVGSGAFDYVIDWGDGTVESYNTDANISHIYSDAGDHITKITGTFPHFSNILLSWPFNEKLKELINWGTISWESLNNGFRGARDLTVSAIDIPIFGLNTIDLSLMFYEARSLTNIPNIDQWDWSKVTAMSSMFVGAGNYQEIATLVGQFNITSNLTNAANFMTGTNTFTSFAGWDVTGAAAGSWNGLFQLMSGTSNMSTEDYDATLISWASQSVNNNVQCSFGISQYTLGGAAEAARNTLINTYGWTITDGGGVFVGLLDTYPNASAAYSLRDLASASVGSAVVRVRRSSDNTEQDFTAVEITDGTLTTFTGANDGFVTTWYDQSGNGNNLIQNSALTQLLIVISGEIILNNGLPSMETNGLPNCSFGTLPNDRLTFTHESEATWSIVYNFTSVGIISRSTGNINTGNLGLQLRNGPSPKIANSSGVNYSIDYLGSPGITNQTVHFLWDYDLSILNMPQKTSMMLNETVVQTGNASVGSGAIGNSTQPLSFNGITDGRFGSLGKYQEWVIWDSRLDSDRAGIQSNINNYYTIY